VLAMPGRTSTIPHSRTRTPDHSGLAPSAGVAPCGAAKLEGPEPSMGLPISGRWLQAPGF
jgi:hypothetical protein